MTDNNKTPKEDSDKTPKAKVCSKRSSMDHDRRVKGGDCCPNKSNAPESGIAKAFNRYAFDEDDPNSGADLHKSDDFCAIVVQSKSGVGPDVPKKVHMVICKFQRFGDRTDRQLDFFWPSDNEKYRAMVNACLSTNMRTFLMCFAFAQLEVLWIH